MNEQRNFTLEICANTNAHTTFDELYDRTVCVAENLQKIGCKQGEVFIFYTNNTADIPAIVYAALCLGCPVTAYVTFASKRENLHYLTVTKPNYVFCDSNIYEDLNECFQELGNEPTFFTFDGQASGSVRSVDSLFQKVESSDSVSCFCPVELDGTKEIAFIVPSSGSTGKNKGVLVSHASILDTVTRLSSFINASDVLLSLSDIYAITGVVSLMAGTINGATRVVNFGPFSPDRFFDVVEQINATVTISTAFPIKQILNHPRIETANLSSYKHYLCGGEKVSLDIIHKMNKFMTNGTFCHGYGMTETFMVITANFRHQKNVSVGQLISGCEAIIVNDSGERLGIGEVGNLCFKLTFPFSGYMGSTENAADYFDHNGFFKTGDIARFDDNGDLFIVDRKKEMFKVGGWHVIPAEIEEFLNKIDGVKQSCLVALPDPEYDFVPAAIIVKTNSAACTEQSIHDAVSNHFAYTKRLQGGVYFVDSLPMTATGKIARRSVAEIALDLVKNQKTDQNRTLNAN
ncbi:luciferin 4-monooxygenase-like [Bradysia coprophila]|uniref:luciferin 4-monooxygenase-like n=1 Tax=Bradysia coprophila TaxID=38358 RepID=UPI00187DC607|nr:luciferin 4-monooxygenase-like [Bradysia coprophila]